MLYRYHVAHSDDALSGLERALHQLSPEDVTFEYEHADTPFRLFFDEQAGVKADLTMLPGAGGLEVCLNFDGDRAEARDLVAKFLIAWNRRTPGFAVVLSEEFPPAM